ncbi:MAG: S8 family serine peptidase [Deltaproteobacteria bacterium]|nr:S8 family serine peptidase [Deltaproteobacteria bacterium]
MVVAPGGCAADEPIVGKAHSSLSPSSVAALKQRAAKVPVAVSGLAAGHLGPSELVVGYTSKRLRVTGLKLFTLHVASTATDVFRYLTVSSTGAVKDKTKVLAAERAARFVRFGHARPSLYTAAAAKPKAVFAVKIVLLPKVRLSKLSSATRLRVMDAALAAPVARVVAAIVQAGGKVKVPAQDKMILTATLSGAALTKLARHPDIMGLWPAGSQAKRAVNTLESETSLMKIDQVFHPGGTHGQGEPGRGQHIGIVDKPYACGIAYHDAFFFEDVFNWDEGNIPQCDANEDCPNHNCEGEGCTAPCKCDSSAHQCVSTHGTAVAAAVGSLGASGNLTGAPFVRLAYDPFSEAYGDRYDHVKYRTDQGGYGTTPGQGVAVAVTWAWSTTTDNGSVNFYVAPDPAVYDPLVDSINARSLYVTTFKSAGNSLSNGDETYLVCSLASVCVGGYGVGELGITPYGSYKDPCDPDTECTQGAEGCVGNDCPERPDVVAKAENVQTPVAPTGYGTVSGTSVAAPAVAGLAALMHEMSPPFLGEPISPQHVKAVLMASSTVNVDGARISRYDDEDYDFKDGAGIPQADRIAEIAEGGGEQSMAYDLSPEYFGGEGGKLALAGNIIVPSDKRIRAVIAQASCFRDGVEHLSSNIDLELRCEDAEHQVGSFWSNSAVNAHEIVDASATEHPLLQGEMTCTLYAVLEHFQDCISWESGSDTINVGFASLVY